MLSRRLFLPVLVLLAAGLSCAVAAPVAGGGGGGDTRTVLPSEAREQMLQRHNEWRLHAGVA